MKQIPHWEQKFILRLPNYFVLLINIFRCGYAGFKGATHIFSEHPENQKKTLKIVLIFRFSIRFSMKKISEHFSISEKKFEKVFEKLFVINIF